MLKLNVEVEHLIHDNATRPQNQIEYARKFEELAQLLEQKEAEITSLEQEISNLLSTKEQIHIFLEALKQENDSIITTFRVSTWHAFVDHATIMADRTIVFHMRNGSTIPVPLEETQRSR